MLKRSVWLLVASLVVAPICVPATGSATPTGLQAPGTTALVSMDPTTAEPGNDNSTQVSVSSDGRYVAFTSEATNLTNIATGGIPQVYVRDMATGVVRLVSQSRASGSIAGNKSSSQPSVSADGRFVAFTSSATNLDPLVTPGNPFSQIYVRDLAPGGVIRLASANASASDGGDGMSQAPVISADGTKIAFHSAAADLVAGATPTTIQTYVTDLAAAGTPATTVVSLQDSTRYPIPDLAGADAFDPSISADGSIVAFTSSARNLTADSTSGFQVFAHSTLTGSTRLVSSVPGEAKAGNGPSSDPSLSADGETITFVSRATDLTDGTVSGSGASDQIYVRDAAAHHRATLVSVNVRGTIAGNHDSRSPSISADGRFVAFASDADNLTPARAPAAEVYLRDLAAPKTTLISATPGDHTSGREEFGSAPAISATGNVIGFVEDTNDASGPAPRIVQQVLLTGAPVPRVERIGAADRFAVSAGVSADVFGPGVPVAYVASGAAFPDALSASAAAGVTGGPVLLVAKDSIPEAVVTELGRLKPRAIVILGGLDSVSATVEATLHRIAPTARVGGADRYVVSAALAAKVFTTPAPVAYVASGEVFPDALSGSAVAGQLGAPVLLVQKGHIPIAIQEELTALKAKRIVVLGGINSVSTEVEQTLGAIAPTTRIAGADRFVVSAAISFEIVAPHTHTVYVASGAVFPDALSGGAAAAANGSPVLLVTKDSIPASVADELRRIGPTRIVVLGGANTISEAVVAALRDYLPKEGARS